jgi:basic membrane protein A and related proteins
MRRKSVLTAALLVLAALATLAAASNGSARHTATPIKAAWIYVGPHNDGGWSQAHDEGRLYVQKMMGDKVKTTYKENVPEGPQALQVIESLIRDGNKIIFATSFGFMDAMVQAAKKHPDVYFEHATGYKTSKNLAIYFGAVEDAIYLAGLSAGAATKNGKVGFIVPFPIPEIIRHTNAFALGVRETRPDATIRLVWTKSWFDPVKERKAAESLAAAGVDVIGQNVDSPSAGQYAESKGIPWVGHGSDASKFAPKQWLSAGKYNWGLYYLKRVQAAANGTWKTGSYWGSLKDGFAVLAPLGPSVSAKTKALIAKRKQQLINGSFYEFTGPLYDQSGKLRVPKGKRMTLDQILTVDWLVKGVIGSPKG